ncbi:hypothetical protein GGU10DRAFT_417457 [Lentinula aff. detonsa]|uniref:Uncharacterized protein n=1 Tax=Lentinula aff. detonsa TaxID=2804958 RepID=A0AA38L6B7_9AGAR|nr:hypothetical protein GGU10DRAFT_417457 [Lentinula aff. detonsa]
MQTLSLNDPGPTSLLSNSLSWSQRRTIRKEKMRTTSILLLVFTILAVLNPLVAVSIPSRLRNALTFEKPTQPVTQAASERNQFEIDAYSDQNCQSGHLGILNGYVGSGRHELEAEGHCLEFVLSFPAECSLEVELNNGRVQRFRKQYEAGGMLQGAFKSVAVEC